MAGDQAAVNFTITARNAASGAIDGVNKSLQGLSTRSIAVGTAIGTFFGNVATKAVFALVGAMRDAVRAGAQMIKQAVADEAAQTRMVAVLKARGLATTKNLDAVEKMIAANQKLGFTDDDVDAANGFVSGQGEEVVEKRIGDAGNIERAGEGDGAFDLSEFVNLR